MQLLVAKKGEEPSNWSCIAQILVFDEAAGCLTWSAWGFYVMWEILNIFNPEKALETSEEDWLT